MNGENKIMTAEEWDAFCQFKSEYKNECIRMLNYLGFEYKNPKTETVSSASTSTIKNNFSQLQLAAAKNNGTPEYPVETPVVYNHAWDEVRESDKIKLILVGDNPGKNEQLHKNQKYLVGQAGKIANGFFKANKEFKIDFKKNVIILNKSPIHSAKTKELAFILKHSNDKRIKEFFEYSQIFTAKKTFVLQQKLQCPIWLVGYGELREKGIFSVYANEIKRLYAPIQKKELYVFQHFSMNRFIIDLKVNSKPELSLEENVKTLGLMHRKEILKF